MVYFLRPDVICLKVEAHTFIMVIGVHLACQLAVGVVQHGLALVGTAAAAYVLAAPAYPFGSRGEVREVAPRAIVHDGDHSLAASSGVIGASVLVAV